MAEIFDTIDRNSTVKYKFRFGLSDQVIHLTQHQIDLIPYLFPRLKGGSYEKNKMRLFVGLFVPGQR